MKTTIQQTGKGVKFFLLIFRLGFLLSLFGSLFIGAPALALAILCLLLLILTKIARWWLYA